MTNNIYQKGLHSIFTLYTDSMELLVDMTQFVNFTNKLIEKYQMTVVGSATHSFEGGGYTCVFALSESHISCHSWPEFNLITMDIFLCNYSRNNNDAVKQITQEYSEYFKAVSADNFYLER